MKAVKELSPEKTYLIIKEIIGINTWYKSKSKTLAINQASLNLKRFFLPIGEVLSFELIKDRMIFEVKFHSAGILAALPRQIKHQEYILEADMLPDYLAGKLNPIAMEGMPTYKGEKSSIILRKKIANFLQSFTIWFNKEFHRKDRLSARKTEMYLLESDEEICKAMINMKVVPYFLSEKLNSRISKTTGINKDTKELKNSICYYRIAELFNGNIENFHIQVRNVFEKFKQILTVGNDNKIRSVKQFLSEFG